MTDNELMSWYGISNAELHTLNRIITGEQLPTKLYGEVARLDSGFLLVTFSFRGLSPHHNRTYVVDQEDFRRYL